MSIRFKFKSDHEYEDVELAGASSISCGDLKQAILDKRMNGSGGAFGLLLTNATTGEEIQAEAEVLAATTVNVKRVPLSRVMSAMPSAADTARSNLSSCQPSNCGSAARGATSAAAIRSHCAANSEPQTSWSRPLWFSHVVPRSSR